jgi:hypothetical protein
VSNYPDTVQGLKLFVEYAQKEHIRLKRKLDSLMVDKDICEQRLKGLLNAQSTDDV